MHLQMRRDLRHAEIHDRRRIKQYERGYGYGMKPEIWLALRETERAALFEHQKRIRDKDKEKRRRAKKEYRRFIDYLISVKRLTPEEGAALELFRMEDRHVQ